VSDANREGMRKWTKEHKIQIIKQVMVRRDAEDYDNVVSLTFVWM
jgi:transposase-like protein